MADHRRQYQYRRTKSSRRAAVWITAAVFVALVVTLIGIGLLLSADNQYQAQVAPLPTLAVLASPTASSVPSDVPPTVTPPPVIVVRVITATPLPVSPSAVFSPTDPPTSTLQPATSTPFSTATLAQTQSVFPTLPPADPPTQAFIASSHQTYYVIVGSANLRACARKDCAIVAPLVRNDAVTVIGYTQGDVVSGSNIWFAVQFGGYQGYVHSSLLGVNQVASTAAPVYVAPPTAYVAPTSIPSSNTGSSSSSSSSNSSGPFTCKDGTISHAAHRQGACSYHGGIAG